MDTLEEEVSGEREEDTEESRWRSETTRLHVRTLGERAAEQGVPGLVVQSVRGLISRGGVEGHDLGGKAEETGEPGRDEVDQSLGAHFARNVRQKLAKIKITETIAVTNVAGL